MKKIYWFAAAAALSLGACSKTEEGASPASIRFINASPDAAGVDFQLAGTVRAAVPPEALVPYFSLPAGNHPLSVKLSASSAYILQANMQLTGGRAYTFIASDSAKRLKLSAVNDEDSIAGPAQVKLRFLHLAPQHGYLGIDTASASGTKYGLLFSGRSLNDHIDNRGVTGFTTIADTITKFRVIIAGTPADTIPLNLSFSPRKSYTIAAYNGSGSQKIRIVVWPRQ